MRLEKIQLAKMLSFAWPKARQVGIFAGLVAVAVIPVVGKALLQNGPRNVPEFLNRLPDANDQEKMRQQQNGQQNFETINAARKKQVSEDTEKLLKLATDLKAEIDKTGKDTLSLVAIRKADAIEKLARNIKDQMKLTLRSN
jgi:hypothetical protein